MRVGSTELDYLAPWLQPSFQVNEQFYWKKENGIQEHIYVGGVICRACHIGCTSQEISLPLFFLSGGIEWYSVKGCTKNITECFKRTIKRRELVSTHCCRRPLCNF
uniref:Uncharacterized protein n=1 Tax=Mandrillus leucophaeus TaxID=9568 RepID=A0A2K5Y579_MANLE